MFLVMSTSNALVLFLLFDAFHFSLNSFGLHSELKACYERDNLIYCTLHKMLLLEYSAPLNVEVFSQNDKCSCC